jgi:hypothetical protein
MKTKKLIVMFDKNHRFRKDTNSNKLNEMGIFAKTLCILFWPVRLNFVAEDDTISSGDFFVILFWIAVILVSRQFTVAWEILFFHERADQNGPISGPCFVFSISIGSNEKDSNRIEKGPSGNFPERQRNFNFQQKDVHRKSDFVFHFSKKHHGVLMRMFTILLCYNSCLFYRLLSCRT